MRSDCFWNFALEPTKAGIQVREPENRSEWQLAVDAANALLLIHAARAYDLIKGGPEINPERCGDMLARGAAIGVLPSKGTPEAYAKGLMEEAARRKRRIDSPFPGLLEDC